MKIYRKIWIDNYGSIPVDADGRSYEIHHVDGNRENNELSNLICVSMDEHYKIHENQGDFAACMAIVRRRKESPEKRTTRLSELGKKMWQNDQYRKEQGLASKSAWDGNEERKRKAGERLSKRNEEMLAKGIHPFQKSWLKDHLQKIAADCRDRVSKGEHNFQQKEYAIASSARAKERNSVEYACPNCGKEGKGAVMKRHHFDRCKLSALYGANVQTGGSYVAV